MLKVSIAILFLCFTQIAEAAWIRYGGFVILNSRVSDKSPDNNALPVSCLAILEISPYQRMHVVYSIEQFVFLVENKPAISDHLQKYLGLNIPGFLTYLEANDSGNKSTQCISSQTRGNPKVS